MTLVCVSLSVFRVYYNFCPNTAISYTSICSQVSSRWFPPIIKCRVNAFKEAIHRVLSLLCLHSVAEVWVKCWVPGILMDKNPVNAHKDSYVLQVSSCVKLKLQVSSFLETPVCRKAECHPLLQFRKGMLRNRDCQVTGGGTWNTFVILRALWANSYGWWDGGQFGEIN